MKTKLAKAWYILALLLVSTSSTADLIAFDLTSHGNQNLISHTNPFEDSFSASSDGFQIYKIGQSVNIPEQLIDRSNSLNDVLGIIDENDTDPFFGLVDTVNSDNSDEIVSSWVFSIAGFHQLSFGVYMAAMGDFEESDYFNWSYSIDGGTMLSLFSTTVDESIEQDYLMANNNVTLADPMLVNGQVLSNVFQTFNTAFGGMGNEITLTLSAKFNGGQEVAAFKGLTISGQANTNTAASVSEPSSYFLFGFCSVLLIIRRKKLLIQ